MALPGSWGYLTDDHPANSQNLYAGLDDRSRQLNPGELLPAHQILRNADELFLAGNTVESRPGTGHASITSGLDLIRRINPKRTWLVHYSGHEDSFGPMSDEQLQDWLNSATVNSDLAGAKILVGRHGMELTYNVQ